jgi:molybdate transport system ATP-binding protein
MFDLRLRHQFNAADLDLYIHSDARVLALFGSSGAGKTSLIKALEGSFAPQLAVLKVAGDTLVDTTQSICVPKHRRRLGVIYQDARLFPHMTVTHNLCYAQKFGRAKIVNGALEEVIELLGLERILHQRPATLSGGEAQRVAIGRALLSQPRALLLDEPLAAIDQARREEIIPYLLRLKRELSLPMILVSHDLNDVVRLADDVVLIDEGRVLDQGRLDQVLANPGLSQFFGPTQTGAVINGHVVAHHPDGITEINTSAGSALLTQIDTKVGSDVRIRVLAKDVVISREKPNGLSALNIWYGSIVSITTSGGRGVVVDLKCGSEHVLAFVTNRSSQALALEAGATCWLVIKSLSLTEPQIS